MAEPVICFGQQPCGIFPNRFLFAKIKTARRLREELGAGRIVFFLHDSDHDYRETYAAMTNRHTGKEERINIEVASKLQKLFSPLYCKRIADGWREKTLRRLPNLVDSPLVEAFEQVEAERVADFCLGMYREMGLLVGIEVARSSDPGFREKAIEVNDYFVDTEYKGETVRARRMEDRFCLHKGGDKYIEVPVERVEKWQISPARDTRMAWMQSVIRCTHYVAGESEMKYLRQKDTPEVKFVQRERIERASEAYTEHEHEW